MTQIIYKIKNICCRQFVLKRNADGSYVYEDEIANEPDNGEEPMETKPIWLLEQVKKIVAKKASR